MENHQQQVVASGQDWCCGFGKEGGNFYIEMVMNVKHLGKEVAFVN